MMKRDELLFASAAILLSAGLVAASNPTVFGTGRLSLYLYWVARLAIEGGLFLAFRSLLESFNPIARRPGFLALTAFVMSLLPFVLAVTAFDIVLGFPELGLGQGTSQGNLFVREFFLEVVYLADDHLFLCLILSLPRLLELRTGFARPTVIAKGSLEAPVLPMLKPPLEGNIIRLEAQEHYVVVVSTKEQRMVLGRFSDFLSTLPQALGMKVHRSHWVARTALEEAFHDNRNMKLRLSNGDIVPVSRSHRDTVGKMLEPE